MNLPFFIAGRYLFAKKSHNVINVISAVCVAGLAIGTAALILILSVYNGFNGIIDSNMSELDPDLLVCPREGKFFTPGPDLISSIAEKEGVLSVERVISDNVFLRYGQAQGIAEAKGVQDSTLRFGSVPLARVGARLQYNMGINPNFRDWLELWYHDGGAVISPSNPEASLRRTAVRPGESFSLGAEVDASLLIVPLEIMEELVGKGLASGIEVRLAAPSPRSVRRFAEGLDLPEELQALDRYAQEPSLYRMMRYEKLAIYMILIFVVIIVAFNILGSLSMLRIEKRSDVRTLQAMGATERDTRRIFAFEGMLITLLGLAIGLVAGLALAIVQQRFGIMKMPGNYLLEAYPVIIKVSDVLLTAAGVVTVGCSAALISSKAASKDPSLQ